MENKKQVAEEKPFKVLALDGGGIRGLYTATLLDRLTDHFSKLKKTEPPEALGDKFDLITGASTGGIIAVGLASGLSIKRLITLYENFGPAIFPRFNCLPTSNLGLFFWAPRFLFKPVARRSPLKRQLEELFSDKTMEDIYNEKKIRLCIPCVEARTGQPVVVRTPHVKNDTRDSSRRAVDVCLATSAAPIYFPMAELPGAEAGSHEVLVDGGLWANNPVLLGMTEALRILKAENSKRPIQIVSVGACSPPPGPALAGRDCSRGLLGWHFGVNAFFLALEAQTYGHSFIAEQISGYLQSECQVIRLYSSPPAAADSRHFALDRAYKKALRVLKNQAVADAEFIQSLYDDPDRGEDVRAFASIVAS